jgi:hypothetical protein
MGGHEGGDKPLLGKRDGKVYLVEVHYYLQVREGFFSISFIYYCKEARLTQLLLLVTMALLPNYHYCNRSSMALRLLQPPLRTYWAKSPKPTKAAYSSVRN